VAPLSTLRQVLRVATVADRSYAAVPAVLPATAVESVYAAVGDAPTLPLLISTSQLRGLGPWMESARDAHRCHGCRG
jgi:hypothetical protein